MSKLVLVSSVILAGTVILTALQASRDVSSNPSGPPIATATAQVGSLLLEETGSLTIPSSFEVTGAALDTLGQILLWSRTRHDLLVTTLGGSVQRFRPQVDIRPISASQDPATETFEVIDDLSRAILRFSNQGNLIMRTPLPDHIDPVGAVQVDDGWAMLGHDLTTNNRAGGRRLLLYSGPTRRFADLSELLNVLPQDSTTLFRISSFRKNIMLATQAPPFLVIVIDTETRRTRKWEFDASSGFITMLSDHSPIEYWAASSILRLDSGFVQSFSDLRSDKRFIVRYDDDGSLAAVTDLNVSVGFLAANSHSRTLVALRRLNTPEVVIYRWRWRGGAPNRRLSSRIIEIPLQRRTPPTLRLGVGGSEAPSAWTIPTKELHNRPEK